MVQAIPMECLRKGDVLVARGDYSRRYTVISIANRNCDPPQPYRLTLRGPQGKEYEHDCAFAPRLSFLLMSDKLRTIDKNLKMVRRHYPPTRPRFDETCVVLELITKV